MTVTPQTSLPVTFEDRDPDVPGSGTPVEAAPFNQNFGALLDGLNEHAHSEYATQLSELSDAPTGSPSDGDAWVREGGAWVFAAVETPSGAQAKADAAAAASVPKSTVTTKGDLIVGSGPGTVARVGAGADGDLLVADSAQTDGVKWATPSSALGGSIPAGMRQHRRSFKAAAKTVVTIFQSGHGWTFGGTQDASSNLNDTTDYALGSQSVRLVTAGTGAGTTLGKLAMSNMDLSASYFMIWVKVTGFAHLAATAGIQMYAGSSSLANYYLCNVLNPSAFSAISDGEWIPVVFDFNNASTAGTPSRSTITDLRFRVQDDNTGNKVTVQFGGVSIIPKASAFPNGVATICWDDVYSDAYTSGRARMDLYNFPGVAAPIIDRIGTAGYLTLAQLKALHVDNGWQIIPHAYTGAAHDARLTTLADNGYSELYQSLDYLTRQGFSDLDDYAYPGGEWGASVVGGGVVDVNTSLEAVVKQFFRTARLTTAFPRQQIPAVTPHRLGALNGQSLTLANFQAEVDRAYTEGEWAIFVWHQADTDLNAKIDYLSTKGIPVKTFSDVIESL